MVQALKVRLADIFGRKTPPKKDPFLATIEKVNKVLMSESKEIRPYDHSGTPGGILILKKDIPTIILSDIHARLDYVISILFYEDLMGYTILDKLSLNLVQILCVGDGVHAEGRAAQRWDDAFNEYKNAYKSHVNMDEEMRESFGVMEMIMEIKTSFPNNFHFLKGNHENITNEKGEGNHPFMKYAHEGPMVDYYVKKFYGQELSDQYYLFEKNLPVFAIGKNFLVSHAEPAAFFDRDQIIGYRDFPEVIEGLTWTDDGKSPEGVVEKMFNAYIEEGLREESFYFGGHRPIDGLYNPRAKGKFIQIHNPDKYIVAIMKTNRKINLERDIIEMKKKAKK